MNFFDWLRSLFPSRYSTGLTIDPRPPEAAQHDYLHEERVTPPGAPVNPFSFPKITVSPYPTTDQRRTQSCVPHGVGLALAIERKADTGYYQSVAAMFPYRLRSNFPAEGSYPQEMFNIYRNTGAPALEEMPTPSTEAEANALGITDAQRKDAKLFAGKNYFTIQVPNNIETLATIAAQGHGVPICLYATYSEWAQEYPKILVPGLVRENAPIKHEVCVLPNSGFIESSVRYVAIQDSALFGGFSLRYLSEDFIRDRVFNGGYWDTVNVVGSGPRPTFHFTLPLSAGVSGAEVKNMQLLLISEGLLASDCATGLLGGLTLAAIRAFQLRYKSEILDPVNITTPTNRWGQMCIKKANQLCGG